MVLQTPRCAPSWTSLCVTALLTTALPSLLPLTAAQAINGGGSSGTGSGPGVDYVDVSTMTRVDILPLVCATLPRGISQCFPVPEWSDYYQQNWQRLSKKAGGRKRRFANSWNGGLDWPSWNSDPWWPTQPSPSGGHPNPATASPPSPSVTCRTPANQSAIYQLSANFTRYPAEAISDELGQNLQFLGFLMKEIVLKKTPPVVLEDEALKAANATCPFTEGRLWEYYSINNAQKCWVLANFGDFVLYRRCNQTRCSYCPDPKASSPSSSQTAGSSWQNSGSSFWGWPQKTTTTPTPRPDQNDSILNRRRCLPEYRATSFWAYCPKRPAGQRIVRDRVIIPLTCSCQSIRCQADH